MLMYSVHWCIPKAQENADKQTYIEMLDNPLIGTTRAEEPGRDTSFRRSLKSLASQNQDAVCKSELTPSPEVSRLSSTQEDLSSSVCHCQDNGR